MLLPLTAYYVFFNNIITDLWDVLIRLLSKRLVLNTPQLTLNGQLGWSALLGANHVLRDTLILSLINGLHVGYQQISTVDNAQPIIKTSANLVQINRHAILNAEKKLFVQIYDHQISSICHRTFFHSTFGSGFPFGGPHSSSAVSPAATRVSFGITLKSSRKTEKKIKMLVRQEQIKLIRIKI